MIESVILQIGESTLIGIGTAVLAIATMVLVIITGYYAKQTKKTVTAIEKSAELSIQPHLKASIIMMGPVAIDLKISNVGNGAAKNIELEFWIETKDSTKKNWNKPLLMPKEGEEFFIPDEQKGSQFGIDYFKQNQTTICIKGKYYDILGKGHLIDDKIDVTAYVNQFENTQIRYQEKPIDKIATKMEAIEKHLREIYNEMRQQRQRGTR